MGDEYFRTKCYWYHEYQDMSASVPTCDYYRKYGECPCEPECEHFITKKEVDDIARNMGKIGQTSDLIRRQDALKPFCVAPDGTRIPEVDCDNFPVEFSVEFIKKHLLLLSSVEPRGNLISREDVINAFAYSAPELFADRDWFETKINMIPSAEAVSREDYHNLLMALNDIDRALRQYQAKDENSSADSDNRHYIKIYADDEPSVKAEKLYQICGETQNGEVAEWLKEYFPLSYDNWIPVSERLPKKEKKTYWVCTDTEYQCECRWTNNRFGIGEGEWGWSIFDTPQYSKPIAWMPLPKPYREENEE